MRAELGARLCERRAELRRIIAAPSSDPQELAEAVRRPAAMPRASRPARRRRRDMVDGRPRGVLSRFGLSRVRFRQMAHEGQLPGMRKASW